MMSLLTVAAANLLTLTIAVADGPPRFDAAAGCKAVSANQSVVGFICFPTLSSFCMKNEEAARQELTQDWTKNTTPRSVLVVLAKPRLADFPAT